MKPLLDEKQVARIRRQSDRTIQKERLLGTGPPFLKIGRLVRYDPDDLEAWLKSKRRRSTSDDGTVG